MKKTVSLILVFMFIMPILSVYGSEDERVMKIVSCTEQDFSTICRPECSYDYTPDGGLTIWLGENEDPRRITIFKADAPGDEFDAETYFNNAYPDLLRSSYGSDLVDPGEYMVYTFADRQMPGRLALFMKDGQMWMRFCLYDLDHDFFVRYEAFSVFDEDIMQDTIDDLSLAVRYFEPDAMYYYSHDTGSETETETETEAEPEPEPEPETQSGIEIIYPQMPEEAEAGPDYKTIICTAQGFSTRCGIYDDVQYKTSLGVTAFLDTGDEEIVWVRIRRLYEPDLDVEQYFQDEVIPETEYMYSASDYSADGFTSFTVDGKVMEGQEFHFTIAGYDYTRRIMICKTQDDAIRFEAQYTSDTYDRVMHDLERVVKFYTPDETENEGLPAQTDTEEYTITKVNGDVDWASIPELKADHVLWTEDTGIRAAGQICYDDDNLYVHLMASEKDIRAENTQPLSAVFEDSCLEFFFMLPDAANYFNFEINPNGCLNIQFGPEKSDRFFVVRQEAADYFDIHADRTADGWEVFYKIPIELIRLFYPYYIFDGDIRANVYKCGNKTVQKHYLAWNPVHSAIPNFHCPEDFGIMHFG